MRTTPTRWPNDLDLALVILGSLLAGAAFAFDLPLWVRLPLGLMATLVLPGYAVSMVLFPPGRLDSVERSALTFALSLAVIVTAAPFINLAPGGLTERTVVGAVSAITSGATAAAWWRRRSLLTGVAVDSPLASLSPRDAGRRLGVAAIGLVGIAVVGLLSRGAGGPPASATEFFLIQGAGAEGLPATVITGTPTTVRLGITNREVTGQELTIVVEAASTSLGDVGPISVPAGGTWTGRVTFTLSEPGDDVEVRLLLFRAAEPEPYRSLRLVVDAVAPA